MASVKRKIYEKDSMTAQERLDAVISLKQPDRVPLALMIYHYAPFYTGTKLSDFMLKPETYMEVMHRVYEEIGPWDIYYNTNPINRLIYCYVMMVWNKLPGLELDDSELPREVEVEYMKPVDYDELINGFPFFSDTFFRMRMLPRFCEEARGKGFLRLGLPLLRDAIRQTIFWRKDFNWWRDRGAVIQSGYQAEMPFDIFYQARGIVNFSMDLFKVPDKIRKAALKLADHHGKNAVLMAKINGVPRVQCYCTRSSNDFISPQQFEELVLPAIETVVNRVVDAGMTPILHCDGNWLKNLKSMRKLPEKKVILQFDGVTDIFQAKQEIGDRMCIFGDVPASKLAMGTPSEIEEYCHKLIEEVGKGGGFILGGG